MRLGLVGYVREVTDSAGRALRASEQLIAREARSAQDPALRDALADVLAAVRDGRRRLSDGASVSAVADQVRDAIDAASRTVVAHDLSSIRTDLDAISRLPLQHDADLDAVIVDEAGLDRLAASDLSPVTALDAVRSLLDALRLDRGHEAQPVLPMATISVTEDMATAMQLHAQGWRSVYHHEILARGLAPEDLRTMLAQRLRWAQGTLQVMLRDNPLAKRGLSLGQRLMYLATMWSYLSGFAAIVYLAAPIVYLVWGVLPVTAWSLDFFARFLPYFAVNQILFLIVARGVRTWRGQQYSLALFPVWIRACATAFANVAFGRPLSFAVTRKDGRDPRGVPWRQIWPQLTAMVLLATALVIGIGRLVVGVADGTGTLVNTAWVAYDLLVLSVIIQAARYRGPAARLRESESDGTQH